MPIGASTGKERHDAGSAGSRAAGGGTGNGGGGFGMPGVSPMADQRMRNRISEINRVGAATGMSTTPTGNTGVSPAGRTSSVAQGMGRDYRGIGDSFIDKIGNFLAGGLGFNEQAPSLADAAARVRGTPSGTVTDNRANWGFDPVTALAGMAGMGLGIPGTGFIGDQISQSMGRPLEIGMGPDVFGGDAYPSQPNPIGGPADNTASGYPGMTNAQLSRSLSYLSGKPVNAATLGTGGTQTSQTTGSMVNSNSGAYDPLSSFGGPSSAVAAARSPFNNQIGGLTAGGYAMGGKGKKSTPTQLAEGLGRFGGGAPGHSQGFI